MKTKSYIVYQAKNQENGSCYVGATGKTLHRRRSEHIAASIKSPDNGCRVFNAALRKYGADAFAWRVLRRFGTAEEALAYEVKVIDSRKPPYNITKGGRGIVGITRSPEWRAKISEINRGRALTPEQRAKFLANLRPEVRHKPVICLDDGKWFESIKLAAAHYGVFSGRICAAVKGREMTINGLHFAYTKRPIGLRRRRKIIAQIEARKAERWRQNNPCRSRAVVCLTNGTVYPSAREAWRKLGPTPSRIMQICQRGGQTLSGLSFAYMDI